MRSWAEKARRLAPAVLAGTVLVAPAPPAAAVTRSEASATALKALGATKGKRAIVVFGLPRRLAAGTSVVEAGPGPSRRGRVTTVGSDEERFVPSDRPLRGRAWLFWADHAPRARFLHPSTLVLVDDRSGRVLRRQAMVWWPLVNGRPPAFLTSSAAYEGRRDRVYARDPLRRTARPRAAPAWSTPLAQSAQAAIAGPPNLVNDCLVHIGDQVEVGNFGGDFKATEQMAATLKLRRAVAGDVAGLIAALRRFHDAQPKCVDAVIWISAHGYPPQGSNFAHPSGNGTIPESPNAQVQLKTTVTNAAGAPVVRSAKLTGPRLRAIMASFPDMTFKLVVDACFSARWTELSDVPNLRVILTASRADQMAFGFTPNGTHGITVQRNAQMTPTGGSATVAVTNLTKAGAFTNAIVLGINAWSTSAEARQQTNEDLGKALALAFTQSPTRNATQILGMTQPAMSDNTASRPHAPAPAPPPPAPAAGGGGSSPPASGPVEYSVTAGPSYRHGPPAGPGGAPSEVCVQVSTNPARPGASARVRTSGTGVVAGGDQTVTLDANGRALVRVGINQYGDYTVGADVTASDGVARSGAGQITVTADPGTCAAP